MRPTFDLQDAAILAERTEKRDRLRGPRIGDFVIFPDGHEGRFTHDWGDEIQTTSRKFGGDASFYLSASGHGDYSGGLDPSIAKSKLVDTKELKNGRFWFFHHDDHYAHNGVDVEVPCRVYRVEAH